MKTIVIAFAVLFVGLTLNIFAQSPDSLGTANAYLASPWKYEGKTIKLNVTHVMPRSYQSSQPGIIYFGAMTSDNKGDFGGQIEINVPTTESEHFARFYGTSFHKGITHRLSGILMLRRFPSYGNQPNPAMSSTSSAAGSGTNAPSFSGGKPKTSGTNTSGIDGVWFVDYNGLSANLFNKNKGN